MSNTDRSEPRRFKSNTLYYFVYLQGFDRSSHLLTHHDWCIMYNACMLLVKLYTFSKYEKQENKA